MGASLRKKLVDRFKNHFPFGEWDEVHETGVITYCGKDVDLEEENGEKIIRVTQKNFIEGRLSGIEISRERKQKKEDRATEVEISDFRSTLGCLQWLSTQTRPDLAFSTNQLQKRVNRLTVEDLLHANSLVREVQKETADLVFRCLGKDTCIVAWHDAALFNSIGVEVNEQEDEIVQKTQ